MDTDKMMEQAMAGTKKDGVAETTAPAAADDTQMQDGTVTIPKGILPPDVKEGDIVQFSYVTETDQGCVLKPVESRIKQPGEPSESEKTQMTPETAVQTAMAGKAGKQVGGI